MGIPEKGQRSMEDRGYPLTAHRKAVIRIKSCKREGAMEREEGQKDEGYMTGLTGEVVETTDPCDAGLVGGKVCVFPYQSCMQCELCRTGNSHLCRHMRYAAERVKTDEACSDGWEGYFRAPVENVYPFRRLSYEEASYAYSLSVGMTAVEKAGRVFGGDAAVLGGTNAGLLTLPLLKANGARYLYFFGEDREELDLARNMGADEAFLFQEEDARDKIFADTDGLGTAMLFDGVGNEKTQKLAFSLCKKQGMIVNLFSHSLIMEYQLKDFSAERSITAATNAKKEIFYDVLRMLEAGKISVAPMLFKDNRRQK